MIKSPWVRIHEKLTTGVHGVGSDYVAKSKSSSLPVLNAPAGTAEWENRTYAGWELVTTTTEYTIGDGQDFATLAAAVASLQGLILVASITLKLMEDITLTTDVSFLKMISAYGYLILDLNGHDLEINNGCVYGLRFIGPIDALIQNSGGACSIKMIATSLSPPYYLVNGERRCILDLVNITLDANSKAFNASARLNEARGRFYNVTWSNEGSLIKGGVYATEVSHGGFITTDPAAVIADRGSILIKTDGTVVTT